jgi:hypothetical protein
MADEGSSATRQEMAETKEQHVKPGNAPRMHEEVHV